MVGQSWDVLSIPGYVLSIQGYVLSIVVGQILVI